MDDTVRQGVKNNVAPRPSGVFDSAAAVAQKSTQDTLKHMHTSAQDGSDKDGSDTSDAARHKNKAAAVVSEEESHDEEEEHGTQQEEGSQQEPGAKSEGQESPNSPKASGTPSGLEGTPAGLFGDATTVATKSAQDTAKDMNKTAKQSKSHELEGTPPGIFGNAAVVAEKSLNDLFHNMHKSAESEEGSLFDGPAAKAYRNNFRIPAAESQGDDEHANKAPERARRKQSSQAADQAPVVYPGKVKPHVSGHVKAPSKLQMP